jgi:hypothetical protein
VLFGFSSAIKAHESASVKKGRTLNEQKGIDATTFIRRASLPPQYRTEAPPASNHSAGHHPGLHSEDQPYTTEDKDDTWPPRMKGSALFYSQRGVRQDRDGNPYILVGNRPFYLHEGLPVTSSARSSRLADRRTEALVAVEKQGFRSHWLVYVGVFMMVMVMGWVVFNAVSTWWQVKQDDWQYGRPRTFQINAVVGHNDSAINPSHFIALNLNRHVEVIEFPGGDATHARIFMVTTLIGEGEDLTPVTLTFQDVTGSGKLDMIVNIGDTHFIFLNENGTFRPARPNDTIHM